jgi:hypothetical protein
VVEVRSNGKGNIMSATQFGLGLLYIAVAVICYAAGWWQAKTVERDRWEERAAGQDQLVEGDQQGREPEVQHVGHDTRSSRGSTKAPVVRPRAVNKSVRLVVLPISTEVITANRAPVTSSGVAQQPRMQ